MGEVVYDTKMTGGYRVTWRDRLAHRLCNVVCRAIATPQYRALVWLTGHRVLEDARRAMEREKKREKKKA